MASRTRIAASSVPPIAAIGVSSVNARCDVKHCSFTKLLLNQGSVLLEICSHRWALLCNKTQSTHEFPELTLGQVRLFLDATEDQDYWSSNRVPVNQLERLVPCAQAFESSVLEHKLCEYLNRSQVHAFCTRPEKLRLYFTAFKYQNVRILEACVRLCLKVPITFCASQLGEGEALKYLTKNKQKWADEYGMTGLVIAAIKGQAPSQGIPLPPTQTTDSPNLQNNSEYDEEVACGLNHCQVKLKLAGKDSLLVCRHELAQKAVFFNSFFGKKQSKGRFKLMDTTKTDMSTFLRALREDNSPVAVNDLPILIKLADRFECLSVIEKICFTLEGIVLEQCSARARVGLLLSAHDHKRTQSNIFQLCLNAFSRMTLDSLSSHKSTLDPDLMHLLYEAKIKRLSAQIVYRQPEKVTNNHNKLKTVPLMALSFQTGFMLPLLDCNLLSLFPVILFLVFFLFVVSVKNWRHFIATLVCGYFLSISISLFVAADAYGLLLLFVPVAIYAFACCSNKCNF